MGSDFSPSRSAAERLYLMLSLRWLDGPLQPCGRQHRLAVPLLQRTEWALSAMIRNMRGLADIHLDVRGGDIIVDLPGTSYTVTYHKPAVSPQLLAAYLPGENDPRTELTQAEFLARARRLANDKARELDWIV
jgi:hypothetical protein